MTNELNINSKQLIQFDYLILMYLY